LVEIKPYSTLGLYNVPKIFKYYSYSLNNLGRNSMIVALGYGLGFRVIAGILLWQQSPKSITQRVKRRLYSGMIYVRDRVSECILKYCLCCIKSSRATGNNETSYNKVVTSTTSTTGTSDGMKDAQASLLQNDFQQN